MWLTLGLLGLIGLIFWGSITNWVESRAEADVAQTQLKQVLNTDKAQKELDENIHRQEILLDQLPPSAHRERLREKLKARVPKSVQ